MSGPLENITILDLTRLLPGPMCTLHLADLGADVIKIEEPGTGDYARAVPPLQKTISKFFLTINRNKRSITLDLRKEKGKELFMKLAEKADVIVESFRPGVVEKLGVGYEAVKAINPSIVYCSITGYGQTGPFSGLAGHDLNFLAYSGIIKPAPKSSGTPAIPNFQIGDLIGGTACAAMSIMASILQQKLQGVGQYLDVSIMDGLIAHSVVGLSNINSEAEFGIDLSDMLNGLLNCYNLYRTKDNRYMALAALEFKFWDRFCTAIERDDLKSRHMDQGENAAEVFSILTNIFSSRTQQEWVDHFENVDCCISPVLTIQEAIDNTHTQNRGVVHEAIHPTEGPLRYLGFPVKFKESPLGSSTHAPALGEHTAEVFQALGYNADALKLLKDEGVL